MRTRTCIQAYSALLLAAGCASDLCKEKTAGFELQVTAPANTGARSMSIELAVGDQQYRKTFDLGAQLDDGETSIAVNVDPPPSDEFRAQITVRLYDQANAPLGEAGGTFEATPDACNFFDIKITQVIGPDGGMPDGGLPDAVVDGGPPPPDLGIDGGVDDNGFADANPDAEPIDLGVDGGEAPDTGEHPDAEPPDLGTPPDAGQIPFPYTPSNFEPALIPAYGVPLVFNCGVTSFDTTTRQFTNPCGPTPVPVVLPQQNGPDVVVIAVSGLHIAAGHSFLAIGSLPLIFAVGGQVDIEGNIDISGTAQRPGPGGSISAYCNGTGTGENGQGNPSGGAGGGGGGFGQSGATGGDSGPGEQAGDPGGESGEADLTPLRGGCAGGFGADSSDPGAGGGGVQISAAGTLNVSAKINAGGGGGDGGPRRHGGGGGGSGGGILLEGVDVNVLATAALVANGGGGGEAGADTVAISGANGSGGDVNAAAGGSGNTMTGGDGGDGQTALTPPGNGGVGGGQAGGGGGGGGVGRIRLNGQSSCLTMGTISPTPTGNGVNGCPQP